MGEWVCGAMYQATACEQQVWDGHEMQGLHGMRRAHGGSVDGVHGEGGVTVLAAKHGAHRHVSMWVPASII